MSRAEWIKWFALNLEAELERVYSLNKNINK